MGEEQKKKKKSKVEKQRRGNYFCFAVFCAFSTSSRSRLLQVSVMLDSSNPHVDPSSAVKRFVSRFPVGTRAFLLIPYSLLK
jgi:hypothetical protein